MDQLSPVVNLIVAKDERFQVSARGLWTFLELKKQFRDWFTYQCGAAHLEEGRDYIEFRTTIDAKVGRPQKDYLLSRRAAYEIGMLNQGDKGKQIRGQFMDAKEERDLLKIGSPLQRVEALSIGRGCLEGQLTVLELLGVPLHLAQQEAVKETFKITKVDFSEHLKLAPAQNNIQNEEVYLEPTELGKRFNLSGTRMNALLCAAGLQERKPYGWEPTKKADGLYIKHSWKKGTKTGYNLKWREIETTNLVKAGGIN